MKKKHKSLKQILEVDLIESAGGLVSNDSDHVLLIFKRGKWDLPKGRLEKNQTIEETAVREVSEEAGLDASKLSVRCTLPETYHTTYHGNKQYLKRTNWYWMHYDGPEEGIPQHEEGIIECRWIHLCDLPHYLVNLRSRIHYIINFWHKNLAYHPRR